MLFPLVKNWIQDNLKTKSSGTVTPGFKKCYEAAVPANLFQKTVSTDLIIFVTATKEENKSFVAWATACQLDPITRRPIMGQIHINLKYLDTKFEKLYDTFGTVIHEVSHILAMSPNLYGEWIHTTTGKIRGEANVLKTHGGHSMIVTEKVKIFTRDHFKCQTLEGAPVEDEGNSGSKGAHWEKRFFGSDYMSAASVTNPVISELSISMFEDSGWYIFRQGELVNGKSIDYEPLFWLKYYGCGIFTDTCPSAGHSCTVEGELGCSYDNTFRGVCAKVGFANNCMYKIPYTPWENYDCRIIAEENATIQLYAARYYNSQGPNRRCFNGKITDTVSGYQKNGNFCFLPKCTYNNTTRKYKLEVQYGTTWHTCTSDNQNLPITGKKKGHIQCPPHIHNYCSQYTFKCKNDCMQRGRCMKNGQCLCYQGFTGDDCGDNVDLKEYLTANSYQMRETIKTVTCQNGGVYISSQGYCLCNVGFSGSTCSQIDSVTQTFYKAPNGSVSTGGTQFWVTDSKGISITGSGD